MRFTDEQIAQMADGYPPQEYDCEQTISAMSKEIAELRNCLREALAQRCNAKPDFKCKKCAYKREYCRKWREALKGAEDAD